LLGQFGNRLCNITGGLFRGLEIEKEKSVLSFQQIGLADHQSGQADFCYGHMAY
jgi:hypothetical protein